jgi:hypothetical protein
MLVNFQTIVNNLLGNTVFNAVELTKDFMIGNKIDEIVSKKLGTKRTTMTDRNVLKASAMGFLEGIKTAGSDFMSTRKGVKKIQAELIKEGFDEGLSGVIAGFVGSEGFIDRILGRYQAIDSTKVTEGSDIGRKRSFNVDKKNIESLKDNIENRKNLKEIGKSSFKLASQFSLSMLEEVSRFSTTVIDVPYFVAAKEGRILELMNINKIDNINNVPDSIINEANEFALARVFQNNSKMRQDFNKVKDFLNEIGNNNVAGNLVLPFTGTPANILDKALDYSPYGLIQVIRQYGARNNGKGFDQKLFVDRLSRLITGTGLSALGFVLAYFGLITAGDDKYEDIRANQQLESNAFSIKLGDQIISYKNLGPLAPVIATGVELYNIFSQAIDKKRQKDSIPKLWDAIDRTVGLYIDISLLPNMNQNIDVSSGVVGSGEKWIKNFWGQLTPSAIKQIARLSDENTREIYDESWYGKEINRFKSNIPGLRETLPVKKDVLGRDMKSQKGFTTYDTLGYDKNVIDPVTTHVLEVYRNTKEAGVLPQVAQDSITEGGKRYQLNPVQYIRYQQISGELSKKFIDKLMKNPDYMKLNNETKAIVLKQFINKSQTVARKVILVDILVEEKKQARE